MATITNVNIGNFDGNTPLSARVTFSNSAVQDVDFISTAEPLGPPTATIDDPETSDQIASVVFIYPE